MLHQVKSLLYPGTLLAASIFSMQANAECTTKETSKVPSLDGEWIAVVQETLCVNDGFAMSSTVDHVGLVKRGAEERFDNAIFAVDVGGHPDERPLVQWLSPSKVELTVPNKSLIGLRRCEYERIEVIVRFEPDDPNEREQWLKKLGIRPMTCP